MRRKFIQVYKLNGRKVIPYDGRFKHLVSKYRHQDKSKPEVVEVVGSVHKARKNLPYQCCDCMKEIKKGQLYIQKNAMILADCFRTHLDCQGCYDSEVVIIISITINGYYKNHHCILLTEENVKKIYEKKGVKYNGY